MKVGKQYDPAIAKPKKRRLKNYLVVTRKELPDRSSNASSVSEESALGAEVAGEQSDEPTSGVLMQIVELCLNALDGDSGAFSMTEDSTEDDHLQQIQQQLYRKRNSRQQLQQQQQPINEQRTDESPILALLQSQSRLIASLRADEQLADALDRMIDDALLKQRTSVNVKSFMLIRGHYRDYPAHLPHAYETLCNSFEAEVITDERLYADMLHLDAQYREVTRICNYLRDRKLLRYVLYKRAIELLGSDKQPTTEDTMWYERLLLRCETGYYYAVIVNFALTKPRVPLLKKSPITPHRTDLL